MGQATVDLPDPAEQSPAPAGSADDLLSQLAGEEIDRMLADADARPSDAPAEDAPGPAAAEPDPYALPTGVESAPTEIAGQPPPAAVEPMDGLPNDAEVAEVTVDASELSELLAAAPGPTPTPPDPEPATCEQPTTTAELAALSQPTDLAATLDQVVSDARAQRPSLPIRVLELINSPLSACPDGVRDLVGKLAILTLMNAIGVLLYLLLFRK